MDPYIYSTHQSRTSDFARSLQTTGRGALVKQLWIRSRHEYELFVYFLPKTGPLPHLSSLSRLVFPFYTTLDLSTLAPSLRRLEIQILRERYGGLLSFLLLPSRLNTLALEGTEGVMPVSSLTSLWSSFEQLLEISTLEISNHNSSSHSPSLNSRPPPWDPSTPSELASPASSSTKFPSPPPSSLPFPTTYPSLLTLGLSLAHTTLPSDPSDAILSHPLLETLEIDDPDGRGIDHVVEWMKFLYRLSKNLLKVPKLGRIKIVPSFVWEYEPEISSEGMIFEVLKGLWDMWVEVEDSRGSIWDEEWAEELEKDR